MGKVRTDLPARPGLDWEIQNGFPSRLVAGVDEVGRGCLAGPVVTAAVLLPPEALHPASRPEWMALVTDSKLIASEVRTELALKIRAWALGWSIGEASVEEIDTLNIHHATLLAMGRAADSLPRLPEHLLVDGKFAPSGLARTRHDRGEGGSHQPFDRVRLHHC